MEAMANLIPTLMMIMAGGGLVAYAVIWTWWLPRSKARLRSEEALRRMVVDGLDNATNESEIINALLLYIHDPELTRRAGRDSKDDLVVRASDGTELLSVAHGAQMTVGVHPPGYGSRDDRLMTFGGPERDSRRYGG